MRDDTKVTSQQLFKNHQKLAFRLANQFHQLNRYPAYERADYCSIAMLGLWEACDDYKADRSDTFQHFASLVIKKHLQSFWRTIGRGKHQCLNHAISIDDLNEQGIELASKLTDPEQLAIQRLDSQLLAKKLKQVCTELEYQAVIHRLAGASYPEIAKELGTNYRAVDNALMRVKRKMNRHSKRAG